MIASWEDTIIPLSIRLPVAWHVESVAVEIHISGISRDSLIL